MQVIFVSILVCSIIHYICGIVLILYQRTLQKHQGKNDFTMPQCATHVSDVGGMMQSCALLG